MFKKAITRVLAGCVFAAVLLSAAPASASPATDASAFVRDINLERTSRGLRALTVRADLSQIARDHSTAMMDDGYIYHSTNLAQKVKGDWTLIGENVGVGPDEDSLHDAFMQSPDHRHNILTAKFNQIGIGVVHAPDGTLYVTELFAARGTKPAPAPTVVKPRFKPTTAPRVVTHRRSGGGVKNGTTNSPAKTTPTDSSDAEQLVDTLIRMSGLS